MTLVPIWVSIWEVLYLTCAYKTYTFALDIIWSYFTFFLLPTEGMCDYLLLVLLSSINSCSSMQKIILLYFSIVA